MTSSYKDMACIVGVGETAYTRGTDKTSLALQLEAILAACDDAGISPHEIDGYVAQNAEDLAVNLGTPDIKFSSMCIWGAPTTSPRSSKRPWPFSPASVPTS